MSIDTGFIIHPGELAGHRTNHQLTEKTMNYFKTAVAALTVLLCLALHAQTAASAQKKQNDAFSFVPMEQLTMKEGKLYRRDIPEKTYTGYALTTRAQTESIAKKDPDTTLIFHKYIDTDNGTGVTPNTIVMKYIPSASVIWEWNKDKGFIYCYERKDAGDIRIGRDNFLEMKDGHFFLKWRCRPAETDSRLDVYDKTGKTVFAAVRKDDSFVMRTTGSDGIVRQISFDAETGQMDGFTVAYHPNGKKFYETRYTDGHPGSIVELYDKTGKKIFRLYFETNLFEEKHTSNLILAEEWDEEQKRFVERDKEHFTLFYAFCNPRPFLFSDTVEAELQKVWDQDLACREDPFIKQEIEDYGKYRSPNASLYILEWGRKEMSNSRKRSLPESAPKNDQNRETDECV